MKNKKLMVYICSFALTASLLAVNVMPTYATLIEDVSAETEMHDETQSEEWKTSDDIHTEPQLSDDTHTEPQLSDDAHMEPERSDREQSELEMPDSQEQKAEINPVPPTEEIQETPSKGLENKDGLIYMDGVLYTGYYMDKAGILYIVSNGSAELVTKTLKEGTSYYNCQINEIVTLPKQTLFVKGKIYSGYYLNRKNSMYHVKKGAITLRTGIIPAGTKYFNYNTGKTRTLSKQTLYVKGKVYSGYYLNSRNKMYHAKKGSLTLVTGTLKINTKYYNYKSSKTQKLSQPTLYIKGKLYSGYYLNSRNKMYHAKKGSLTLTNTGLNAGTRYYSYSAKKTLKLPALTVYVNGKAMEGMSPESLATLQRAQTVLASITTDSMSKEKKLRTCFEFVKTYQGAFPRIPHYMGMDWPVVYANDMFLNDGKGNCFSYAAAFAYLAKAIGYKEVYCCSSGGHGWAEIDGLIYDPERNKFDPSYSYYALSYDTKTNVDHKGGIAANEPWMHIKI